MNDRFPQVDIVATGWKIKMIMDAKGLSVKDVQKYLKLSSPQLEFEVYLENDEKNIK